MNNTYWILNIVFVALWLFAFAFAILGGWRYGRRHGYTEVKQVLEEAQVLAHDYQREAEQADEQILHLQAEIKALHMQTIEVPEVKPLDGKPKRGGRGKAKEAISE